MACTSCDNEYSVDLSDGTCKRKVPPHCLAYDDSFTSFPVSRISPLSNRWPAASPPEVAQCCLCEDDHYLWIDRNLCTKDCNYDHGRIANEPLMLCLDRFEDQNIFTDWYQSENERLGGNPGTRNNGCYPLPESFLLPDQSRVRGRSRATRKNGRARFSFGKGSS